MPHDLILINPPTMLIKPEIQMPGTWFVDDKYSISAINPGIISIASYLVFKKYDVEIYDFQDESDFEKIRSKIKYSEASVYGISSTSGFDYLECLKIAKIIKQNHPGSVVIAGGQHIGVLQDKVFMDSQDIDIVVKGAGEFVAEEILNALDSELNSALKKVSGIVYRNEKGLVINTETAASVDINQLPGNDFTLFPNYKNYTPFVEESRGCAGKCSYCTNSLIHNNKISIKRPKKFEEEFERTVNLYGLDKDYVVLAANFGLIPKNTKAIINIISKYGVNWNTELRADNRWESYIDALIQSNLEILSVGFESASPQILRYMKKTIKPDLYIRKMRKLIERLSGIESLSLRINLMLFLGETPETLKETLIFLVENSRFIDGIIASPVFIFENTPLMNQMGYFHTKYGASLVDNEFWKSRRLYPVNVSSFFTFEELVHLGNSFEKIFSSPRSWMREKKYHYKQESLQEKNLIEESLIKSRFQR